MRGVMGWVRGGRMVGLTRSLIRVSAALLAADRIRRRLFNRSSAHTLLISSVAHPSRHPRAHAVARHAIVVRVAVVGRGVRVCPCGRSRFDLSFSAVMFTVACLVDRVGREK